MLHLISKYHNKVLFLITASGKPKTAENCFCHSCTSFLKKSSKECKPTFENGGGGSGPNNKNLLQMKGR